MRYLTNEYQYVTLRLMHNFALGRHGGAHEPLALASFDEAKFATYRVPPVLEDLAQHLETEAAHKGRAPLARDAGNYPNGRPPEPIACRTPAETKWLRNQYLHRSAQLGDIANDERRNAQHLPERQFIAG